MNAAEQKASAEQDAYIEALESKVAQLEEELQRFVYAVSHDLNAPMRACSSFARLLEQRYSEQLDDRGKRYLEFIGANGSKAQQMIEALLTYSRIDSRAEPPQAINVEHALECVLGQLKPMINEKAAVIELANCPTIYMDAKHCSILFYCLINNALTYTKPDMTPHVLISGEKDEAAGEVTYRVQDNGVGIDPRFHEDVFTIFRRLHAEEEYPGIGAGLALAKRIIEKAEGRIWVESNGQNGTTLCFTCKSPHA
tara:strand:- start:2639 stop:3400 length:762 start_codon:yes stop_codon:yes gene_type:complete